MDRERDERLELRLTDRFELRWVVRETVGRDVLRDREVFTVRVVDRVCT